MKELRKLSSFVLDPLDFKKRHQKLLSILSADVVEGLLSVLVQFYDPLYRCFIFLDYQLVPTLEEYAHILGIPVSSKVPFSGLEEIPRSHLITEALHLKKSEIEAHWIIDCCGEFSNVPLIGTQGGINYNPVLALCQLGFPLRDKPNNTLLEGIFYQEGKYPKHLKQKMIHVWRDVHRKGRSELGPGNCVALEAYTLWMKKRALELKMPYACERPISMVVVEPLTLLNQDVEELEDALAKMKQERDMWEEHFHALSRKHEELQLESKDKDALIELLEDRVTKRQREPEVSSSSSMPSPSIAWKKIVDQLVLEKTQMKTSFES
ncbi:hypothetical protein KIW84_063881 [Lathyrus oleraceus]|uniref:DUF7745 domain-containing protein n=1 Tax=Pisum sativum TaxID=3888 RepID=A0A9D4WB06_PEA|nr:hypothetical protein KIW84_063881 [Pisum sativum]